jgi:hypothetical protein
MKILTALKKIKHLDRKITKNVERIGKFCSYIVENEADPKPVYNEEDIKKFIQQCHDWTAEKIRIRLAIHATNVAVKARFEGKDRSIDELLLIQNVLIPNELTTLKSLRRKEKGTVYSSRAGKDSYVVLQYDPKARDAEVERAEFMKEKLDELIDNLNIETDVIGLD